MKIYVGNLPYSITEDALQAVFAEYGTVEEASIPADRDTGRSRGFGFVTMPDDTEARAAIEAINGADLDGRAVRASEARPKSPDRGGGRRW